MPLFKVITICAAALALCACGKETETPAPTQPLRILCHGGAPSLGIGEADGCCRFVWNLTAAYMEMEIDAHGLGPGDGVSLTLESLSGTLSPD